MSPQILLVLDFDNTVIAHSASKRISVQNLLPEGVVSEEIDRVFREKGWDAMRAEVFRVLHKNGVTRDEITRNFGETSLVDGMLDLFEFASDENNGCDVIVISDNGIACVEETLREKKLLHHVKQIFAKPCYFTDDDLLVFEEGNDPKCNISNRPGCKANTLKKYLTNNCYDFVCYVGDGKNDLCPVKSLGVTDLACPRKNFSLDRMLGEEEIKKDISCKVVSWTSGQDIISALQNHIKTI